MPLRDGTGPLGFGPKTGRGRGWCRTGLRSVPLRPLAFGARNRWLFGLAAPVIVAAIRDLANPRGVLRHLAQAFLSDKKKDKRNISHVADYAVINETRPSAKPAEDGKEPAK
ncbi:MAG: DUF5320 domain-containing protein [Chitinispirillaceae bacterium]|nr:DUF5320 domain-containing protein [Chitinispirillaceae bacterium]